VHDQRPSGAAKFRRAAAMSAIEKAAQARDVSDGIGPDPRHSLRRRQVKA